MKILEYIGKNISKFLEGKPYSHWKYTRCVEEEDVLDPGVDYIFDGHGIIINCNVDNYIRTIFLYSEEYGGVDKNLIGIPFSLTRKQVLSYFDMQPDKSGEGFIDPILGEYGGYDRFRISNVLIHVEYKPKKDEIKMITLMSEDLFPM